MFPHPPVGAEGAASSFRRQAALAAALVMLSSCGKDAPEPRADSTKSVANPAAPAGQSPVAPESVVRWNAEDGSAIYLPGTGGGVQVILPPVLDDSVPKPSSAVLPPGAAPASIDLFSPAGLIGSLSVGEFTSVTQAEVSMGCDAWPVVPMRQVTGTSLPTWRIGLQHGIGTAIPTDSIGGLPRADSGVLVVEINKSAALLPLDSSGVMRRVPFDVATAYRFMLAGDVDVVIAVVERRLNVEASPRIERSVLVLERARGARVFKAAWTETQYGTEDDLIAVDLLGVVSMRGTQRPTVFLGQDFGDGSRIQMLQRDAAGTWSVHWSSAYTGC